MAVEIVRCTLGVYGTSGSHCCRFINTWSSILSNGTSQALIEREREKEIKPHGLIYTWWTVHGTQLSSMLLTAYSPLLLAASPRLISYSENKAKKVVLFCDTRSSIGLAVLLTLFRLLVPVIRFVGAENQMF